METLKNAAVKEKYDSLIANEYENEYEFERWHTSQRLLLDYSMMYRSIRHHTKDLAFTRAVELGPGPGTWTRVLYRYHPDATYELVDISEEMKQQFYLEMRGGENVTYHVSDIYDYEDEGKFDLFFSSRAIEYIEDPSAVLRKVKKLLTADGEGVIVTKNPDYLRLRKRRKDAFHSGDISPTSLTIMLSEAGFGDIKVFPCIVRIPVLDRITTYFSEKLFKEGYKKATSRLSRFTESYVVTFSSKQ